MSVAFDLPRGEVFAVDEIDLRLDPAPHPYAAAHREAIAEHWAREHAANPALFDGPVAFFSALRLAGRRLEGRCHLTGFSTFLQWRAARLDQGGEHCFAHGALVCGDGALLAVRMARHTANAGKVYFAAGSFDMHDIMEGRIDAAANIRREVGEETGLDVARARADAGWHCWSRDGRTVIFRRYRFRESADELARRVRDFVAAEAEPEIEGPVIIRRPEDLPADTVAHMPALVGWHFAHGA